MNRDEDTIYAEALRWHAASEGDAMDWDGFTAWLEADARHRDAYDAVAMGELLLVDHREALCEAGPVAANDDAHASLADMPPRRGWTRWAGAAIAASLIAVIGLPYLMPPPRQDYATDVTSETIALADGSSVVLAPHSSLNISGRHQDRMALNGGAWFDIRHDPSRTLSIQVGGVEIGDIGTRFDVQEAQGHVRIEVAEGRVRVSSAMIERPIHLAQGRGLLFDAKAGTAVIRPVAADSIGEWRSGRLSFDSASLALVAADLSRYAGVKVTVAPEVRSRQFSGTLVTSDGEAALRDLSQVMDIELRRDADGIVLDRRR